jgi:hypothetical protein
MYSSSVSKIKIQKIMLEPQNRIIIVDNVKQQLEILGRSFFENGLGCRTFEYSIEYDKPLKNIRVAFFDINLTEATVDHHYDNSEEIINNNGSVFNDLAYALNQYIAKDNGPYILIFWTANKDVVDAFIKYIQDPNRGYSDTASPLLITCIDKNPYTTDNEEEAAEKQKNLSESVLELLDNEKIKFLLDFEERALEAGVTTMNRLYEIMPKDPLWGESSVLFDNLDSVLSKIGSSTLGFEHAKENPKKAVYEGLIPILNHELLKQNSTVNWESIVKSLLTASKQGDIKSPEVEIQNKVNSIFHIDEATAVKDGRGCVLLLNNDPETLNTLSIDNQDDWISKLISIKDANPTQVARRKEILKNSKLIAIEFSAACDYSNRKPRINKYILGVLTSSLNPDLEKDLNLKTRPESCYNLGGCSFNYNESNYQIWLNLNYVFGAKADDTRLGKPIFILKKEIMDMLGNKYASHVSRIGITSF